MDIGSMIEALKSHPQANKMGMIVSHLGIVRGTSRNGREVTEIDVSYDHDVLRGIINDIKKLDGIVEVLVDTHEGHLRIGDEVMAVVVGGDIRENVFAALSKAVNRIKGEASKKTEYFR